MTAAKTLADQGYHTYLIEKTENLGGQARSLHETWQGDDIQQYLSQLINAVQDDENIEIFLNSEVTNVDGFVGNFKTSVAQKHETKILEHGVTIIASGAEELKPDQYLHGQDPR